MSVEATFSRANSSKKWKIWEARAKPYKVHVSSSHFIAHLSQMLVKTYWNSKKNGREKIHASQAELQTSTAVFCLSTHRGAKIVAKCLKFFWWLTCSERKRKKVKRNRRVIIGAIKWVIDWNDVQFFFCERAIVMKSRKFFFIFYLILFKFFELTKKNVFIWSFVRF